MCCQDILTGQVHRWERRSAGAGSKGHRLYDWAMHAVRVKGQDPADGFRYALPTLIFSGPGGRAVVPGWRPLEQYLDAARAVVGAELSR